MAISKKDVEHVAMLARLYLTEAEKEMFTKQLDQILEHAGKVKQADTKGLEPTSHAVAVKNVFREDVVCPGLTRDAALKNAPKRDNHAFVVPKIV